MNSPLIERIRADFDASTAQYLHGGASLRPRHDALNAVLSAGLPTTRDEGFRYTQLRNLEKLKFSVAMPCPDAEAKAAAALPQRLAGFTRLVFIDGRLSARLSDATAGVLDAQPATEATSAALAPVPAPLPAPTPVPAQRRFDLLNAAFAVAPVSLASPAGGKASHIELVFVAVTESAVGASYPRVLLRASANSNVQLVERHVDADSATTFTNAVTAIELQTGAQCAHYRLQSHNHKSVHLETLSVQVAARARLALHSLHVGAASSRSTVNVALLGEHASAEIYAAHAADGQQVLDTQVTVEHAARHVSTVEVYRGIAAGRSRVAFNGQMLVRESAPGAATQQSLRALLAGPDTEADLRPQLEIYTDDVRASHGATVGKLDDNMLFYLLSRGIEPATAQSLLKWAFMADVINKIDVVPLRRAAQQLVLGQVQGLIGEALA